MKRILLIGYNFSPEPTGIGKYSGEMINWLARNGYQCSVITAYPYYPFWKIQDPYKTKKLWYKTEKQEFDGGGKIKVHRCPIYVPGRPTGLKRILLDFSFSVTAFLKLLQLVPARRFDYVITIVPSFQFGLLGIIYKWLRKSKLFYHIQDMQIEAARDLQMIRSEKIIKTLFKVENFIFKQCDGISCVGEGMVKKTQEKTKKKIVLFPNWADVEHFYPVKDREGLKKELGFKTDDRIILYSGAIGEKQGLESVVHAAQELQGNINWKFLICGSGPYKQKLQELSVRLGLSNIKFCSLQPAEKFNDFLNVADLHLVIQKGGASDLLMPSKLTTILAVGGLALVTANKGSGLHAVVEKYKIGLLAETENQQSLIEGIRNALTGDYSLVKRNARAYAEYFLSIDKVMGSFENSLIMENSKQDAAVISGEATEATPWLYQDRLPVKRDKGTLLKPEKGKLMQN